MGAVARTVVNWVTVPVAYALDKVRPSREADLLMIGSAE